MSNLIKIRDVSSHYDITARTLRYYEDMGVITSSRGEDYAHRLYDEMAITRLEQIFVLRKLSISIKDIKRIFDAQGSEVMLEVLNKKANEIDDEVALLHELKGIVLDFIRQIGQTNFHKESDMKLLYDKAKELEMQLASPDDNDKPSTVNRILQNENKPSNVARLIQLTDRLNNKMSDVMVVELPKFRAIVSGWKMEDEIFHKKGGFNDWLLERQHLHKEIIFGSATFWLDKQINVHGQPCNYIFATYDGVTAADAAPYEIAEFEGGLYAAAFCADVDMSAQNRMYPRILYWIEDTDFEHDGSRAFTAQMLFESPEIKKGLGYNQFMRYVPIKLKVNPTTKQKGDDNMDYKVVKQETQKLICLTRHVKKFGKETLSMWETFTGQNYFDVLEKYSSDPQKRRYVATIYSENGGFRYCIGTAYNGKDFSHDNNFAEPIEVVTIPAGEYISVAML